MPPHRSPSLRRPVAALLAALACCTAVVRGATPPLPPPATPARPDAVYLQESGRQIPTAEELTAVAVEGERIYLGTAKGLRRLDPDRDQLQEDPALAVPVQRLVRTGGALWALTPAGLHRHDGPRWTRIGTEAATDVAAFRDEILATAGNRLYRVHGDTLEALPGSPARFELTRLVPHQDSLFVHGPGRLACFAFGRFGGFDAYGFAADEAWDWGALPSPRTRDVLGLGNQLWIATDRGLGVLRGMSMTALRGADGLPFEDLTCLAHGFTNDVWIGTTDGAIRAVDGAFHYFAGRRWLPGDRVNAIAAGSRAVYVATDRGLGILGYQPYTLAKKAAYYEAHLEAWGQKRLGFLHKLEWDGPTKQFVREVSDNDGGYSGYYLAAQTYRWAVTRDPAARAEATNTFHALRWLRGMTGIPGFPARSVWVKSDRGHQAGHGSGGYAAEWHDTADGKFEWKGDTSSDELCSHFYAFSLFLELAATPAEAALAREHLAEITRHLVRHQWQLIDLDGKPTRWGRWDPEYFLTDEGRYDRGLQAVELLSFVKTAEVLVGDPEFAEAYRKLVALGYPAYTLRARNTFPPDSILHFLDELGFWSWWTLLRYEQDPELRAHYRRGYERNFEVVRVEHNPWFNFLYAALTGNEAEPDHAVAHLREWPLDLRVWSYRNSHRTDLRTPAGYTTPKGGIRAFSPREHEPMRWDAWTMKLDGGSAGQDVVEPGSWLLAYWMGRYHGFIAAPTTTDPGLLTVRPDEIPPGGALPYQGPGRPAGF